MELNADLILKFTNGRLYGMFMIHTSGCSTIWYYCG